MVDVPAPQARSGRLPAGRRSLTAIAVVVAIVAVVVVAAVTIIGGWSPSVPDTAPTTLVGRAILEGEVSPDAAEGVDPATLAPSPIGSDCLDQIDAPAGPLALCWSAYRDPFDSDPDQDYYRLRIYGTFGGETGTGVRWVALRAKLVGEPSSNVFLGWPEGTLEGSCQQLDVSIGVGPMQQETICGRTTGTSDTTDWGHRVVWTCTGCLIADHGTRGIALQEWLAVKAGTIPSWEIYADLGG